MNHHIRWIGMAALVLAAGCGRKETQMVQPRPVSGTETVVWVDQAGITSGQIQREVGRLIANVPRDLPPDQLQAVQMKVLQQAVDNLVVRQLVKAELERSGVRISREEIEKGKQDLEKGLGEGHSLALLIAQANLPMEELEDNLRLDLFKNQMVKDTLAAALAGVTAEAVKTYYDEHPEEFTIPAGRLASHILVRVPPGADGQAKTDLRAKAEGIRQALLEGADFAKLASEVSDCQSRGRGGVLGLIPRGREAQAFEDAVYGQEIGAIGEVVESPMGYHVIVATGEQEQAVLAFEDVQDRLAAVLKAKAQQKVTAEYIEGLKNKATIKLDASLAAKAAPSQKEAGPANEVPAQAQ